MILKMLVVAVFLMASVSASNVVCTIVDDKVLVEVELSDGDNVFLPAEYSLLERDGNKVSFISREFIRKDGDFIFALPIIINGSYDLEVVLPSGFFLSQLNNNNENFSGLVYPKNYELSSDGKSIILKWNDINEEVVVFYNKEAASYFWFFGLSFLVFILGFIFWIYEKRRFNLELDKLMEKVKKKGESRVEVSYNLFGEEKRIVDFLNENGTSWMKEIIKGLGISKVMATRKVRSLVEKGIVEKKSFGREARIKLKKKVS